MNRQSLIANRKCLAALPTVLACTTAAFLCLCASVANTQAQTKFLVTTQVKAPATAGCLVSDADGIISVGACSGTFPRLDQVLDPTADKTFNMGTNNLYLVYNPTLGSATFSGVGLNDATFIDGAVAGNVFRFDVEIDSTGATDTFKWSTQSAPAILQASTIPITGGDQYLADNVSVHFNATTGHTVGDKWSVTVNQNGYLRSKFPNSPLSFLPYIFQIGTTFYAETYTDLPQPDTTLNPINGTPFGGLLNAIVTRVEYNGGGDVTAFPMSGIRVQSNLIDSGSVAENNGLLIEDQTAGSTNYAIKTGLGAVDFGDTVKGASTINAVTGFQVNGAAPLGNVLRGNDTNFVSATLACADLSDDGSLCASSGPLPANEAGAANNFLTAYNSATGAWTKAQPTWANIDKTTSSLADLATRACANLSDGGTLCASSAALPANEAGAANNFLTAYNSGTGAFSKAQPAISNLASSSSSDLRTVLSDETGTGVAIFNDPQAMTLNVESGTNSVTTVSKIWIDAAACVAGTAASNWDMPDGAGDAQPTAACNDTGSIQRPTLSFSGSAVNGVERSFRLPSDWTGNIDLDIEYLSTAASPTGNVEWEIQTICRAAGETWDASFNAAQTITDAQAAQNVINSAEQAGLTTTTCAAGEMFSIRIWRDGTNDTSNDVALMLGAELTIRRAQ